MQKLLDNCKRLKQWTDYKTYRNKTKHLIRKAKRNFFSISVINSKDSKTIWKHLRSVKNGTNSTLNQLPDELIVGGETFFLNTVDIATKLNEYFCSIAEIIN